MHAHVAHRAVARLGAVHAPGRGRRLLRPPPAEPAHADVEWPAHVAGFDHGVEALHRGGEAPVEARHADAPGARGRLHHVAPLGGGHGERLLAEHVGAPGEGGERDGVMQVRR